MGAAVTGGIGAGVSVAAPWIAARVLTSPGGAEALANTVGRPGFQAFARAVPEATRVGTQIMAHLPTGEAGAALIPQDRKAAEAIKIAKHDPELHKLMQQAERRTEQATVTVGKGSHIGADYLPKTRSIIVDPTKMDDPGYLGHETMHFLSHVSRSPFWQPLRLNEYLAEYAGTAGHPEEAEKGYQYGKLPKGEQEALRKEYLRLLDMHRDYVRGHTHEGKYPRGKKVTLDDIIKFWMGQPPLKSEKQPAAID